MPVIMDFELYKALVTIGRRYFYAAKVAMKFEIPVKHLRSIVTSLLLLSPMPVSLFVYLLRLSVFRLHPGTSSIEKEQDKL